MWPRRSWLSAIRWDDVLPVERPRLTVGQTVRTPEGDVRVTSVRDDLAREGYGISEDGRPVLVVWDVSDGHWDVG